MGYHTDHTLDNFHDLPDEVIDRMEKLGDYFADMASEDGYCGGKWYDHDEDFKALSKEFPDIVFELSGSGEGDGTDSPDLWRSYYKDGKVQTCVARVSYAPYDEKELS